MVRSIGLLFVSLSAIVRIHAQCPVADFSISASACQNENLLIQNNSTGATSYEWDFCSGDLALNPSASLVVSNTLLFRTRSIRIVKEQGNWYGFTIDQASSPNRMVRFNFGASLTNTPTVTDLGNPSGAFNGVLDLILYKEGSNWFALVANTGASTLLKLSFGSSLDNSPGVQNLGTFGVLNSPNGLSLVNDSGTLHVFITNGGTSGVIHLDFGNSINNSPTVSSFALAGSASPRGIAIIRECDKWFGLVTSYGNNKVFWIDFVSGLNQPPLSGELTFFSSFFFPVNVSINLDGGEYTAFVQSAIGPLYRLSFGSSIIDKLGAGINLGDFFGATSDENSGTEWIKDETDWYGFSIDLTNRRLYRFTFPTPCSASIKTFTGAEPPLVSYSIAATNKISLLATSVNGSVQTLSKNLTVTSATAPDITFTSQNICVNHDVNFDSQNSSGDIVSYDWDFGDTNSSTQQDPMHQYTSNGDYQIELEVTAGNGCKNLIQQQLTIYNEPIADFTTPSVTPICTNQNFLFGNTTPDVGYLPLWEWRINGTLITNNEDLSHTFTNTANQEIRLKASIPGCENEMIKNINSLVEGPLPDFSFTGQCEETDVAFINNSTGIVSGYSWNFDDGQSSTAVNPVHVFSDRGSYDVTLTATNIAGCNNTITKMLPIYSKPEVNFAASLPPFSCNGTPTSFNDLTPNPVDSNIDSWLWNFGDSGSGQNTSALKDPTHTYATAGNYDVSLTVSTNFLCSSILQLPITISQTPAANFNFSPSCVDVAINFTDTSIGTIQSWDWQIGSTFYTIQNPTHTFNNAVSTNAVLNVTASNNCIGSMSKPIVVPAKLVPDFAFIRNCTEQQTLFTDITNSSDDPVTVYNWDFAGLGSASTSPANFTFSTIGNKNVTLALTTQTGCEYFITKPVDIGAPPQANFTTSPETGPPPLEVQFTNTSVGATSYLWSFNDSENTTNTEVSPLFTFQELGEYEVNLIAYNSVSCSDTIYQHIQVVPITDLDKEGNFYFRKPYPNPAHENLFLGWSAPQGEELEINLLDIFGRPVLRNNVSSTVGDNETSISLKGLQTGVYLLQMRLGERKKIFRVLVNPE